VGELLPKADAPKVVQIPHARRGPKKQVYSSRISAQIPVSANGGSSEAGTPLRGTPMKNARFTERSAGLIKQPFRVTFPLYTVTLTIMSMFIVIFCVSFFVAYFDPNFVAEYRAASPISTVLGFMKGINPFQEEFLEMYGNLYSVLWPGVIYLIAKLFGLATYDQIRLLMFVLNAVIVMGTAAAAFYIGLRNKLNALLALAIGFTYVLINSTHLSMGTFSYASGLSCSFFALVLVSNRFDRLGLCLALALITLASLFKIYFALLGIVVLFNCAAFIPLRILSLITFAWALLTASLFFGLTRFFPFYFDSVYCIHKMDPSWNVTRIMPNIRWFVTHFGFIFAFTLPQLVQFKHRATGEKRRQSFYAVGSLIACAFVLIIMLPHGGNFGTYLLHLVAPIILAYALSSRKEFSAEFDRRTGQVVALAICLMVFVSPKHWSSPLQYWEQYGVVWRDDLNSNRIVFMNVDDLIQSNAGREIYVDPMFAKLAVKRNLRYVHNGNREAYVEYLNVRRKGILKLSPLISWLAAPEVRGPERSGLIAVWEHSDVVICTYPCPSEGKRFDRYLGKLTTAWHQVYDIAVVRR
jgi:hypothetical protein